MKKTLFFVLFCLLAFAAGAQQRINTKQMSFLPGLKPNNILYHDTLYSGSKQFSGLFYRSGDPEVLYYYQKHQSNKITGNIVGLLGTLTTTFGILAAGDNRKGGWYFVGGGFAATLVGGYLIMKGQQNLANAVVLFNEKHNRTALSIGVAPQRAGLAYNF